MATQCPAACSPVRLCHVWHAGLISSASGSILPRTKRVFSCPGRNPPPKWPSSCHIRSTRLRSRELHRCLYIHSADLSDNAGKSPKAGRHSPRRGYRDFRMASPFPWNSLRDEQVERNYTFGAHGADALSWHTKKDVEGRDGYQAIY